MRTRHTRLQGLLAVTAVSAAALLGAACSDDSPERYITATPAAKDPMHDVPRPSVNETPSPIMDMELSEGGIALNSLTLSVSDDCTYVLEVDVRTNGVAEFEIHFETFGDLEVMSVPREMAPNSPGDALTRVHIPTSIVPEEIDPKMVVTSRVFAAVTQTADGTKASKQPADELPGPDLYYADISCV